MSKLSNKNTTKFCFVTFAIFALSCLLSTSLSARGTQYPCDQVEWKVTFQYSYYDYFTNSTTFRYTLTVEPVPGRNKMQDLSHVTFEICNKLKLLNAYTSLKQKPTIQIGKDPTTNLSFGIKFDDGQSVEEMSPAKGGVNLFMEFQGHLQENIVDGKVAVKGSTRYAICSIVTPGCVYINDIPQ